MRASSIVPAVLLLASLAPVRALADCPQWMIGPMPNFVLAAPNGTNGSIGASTFWDPDGAGPLQPELVIGGAFSSVQGVTAFEIAARSPETGQWSPLGSGLSGQVMAMTVYNGDLIVAGTIATAGGTPVNYIAGWNGTNWYALGSGVGTATYIRCLTVFNGQLIAGGSFLTAGGQPASNIASWDGASWHPLGSGVLGSYVVGMTVWNGELIAGGVFLSAGGVTGTNNVAMWDGANWHAMGSGVTGGIGAFQPFNGQLYAMSTSQVYDWNGSSWSSSPTFGHVGLDAITATSAGMYVAGSATTGGGGPANGVFAFDGTNLTPLGVSTGITGTTFALTILNNHLVAMGSFAAADGRPAKNIAVWDGADWGSFGGGVLTNVQALTTFGGRTVGAGEFHLAIRNQDEAHEIIGWDGATAIPYGTGTDGPVAALKSYSSGIGIRITSFLVAGGSFQHAGSVACSNIARWSQSFILVNPPAWAPMGAGFSGPVAAIERFNNVVYAGGTFTNSGGTVVNDIAAFNETSGQWQSVAGGMNGPVYALKVFGSYLYAGGAFTSAGGVSTGGLARWDGASWSAVGGFFGGTVYALEVHNGALVMAGSFPGFGGSPNLSSFNGSSYLNLGSGGANNVVRALHSTGPRLYAGGDFTSMGGGSASHLAYWDGSWHEPVGGTDNSVYALGHTLNHVDVGGIFSTEDFGSFVGTADWARFDETGIPEFRQQPFSVTSSGGDNVTFTAVPDTGYTSISMRWYHDGVALSDGPTGTGSSIVGSTAEILNILNVTTGDLGNYFAVVTHGACGSDTSATASLNAAAAVGPGGPGADVFEAIGPNPSAGATRLEFSLARAARVSLAVHDVAGRVVRAAELGTLAAGHHQAEWDARGADGRRVSAGVYFVALQVDGRPLATRRIAIVR